MRVAIVSDTHLPRGARRIPDACLERLRSADLIIHAGDWMRAEIVAAFRVLGPPVHGVYGNVDDRQVRGLLPEWTVVHAGDDVHIGVIHDAGPARGRLERMRARFRGCQAVIYGHSHIPLHETSADGAFQLFNPGSPTDRRRAPTHTMGMATVRDGAIAFELIHFE